MCTRGDHPPYDPPLYEGPRCERCGGDHFPAYHEAPDDSEELEAAAAILDSWGRPIREVRGRLGSIIGWTRGDVIGAAMAPTPDSAYPFPPTPADTTNALQQQGIFRSLDDAEAARFRRWARENFKPGSHISPLWHPVVRAECEAMEAGR